MPGNTERFPEQSAGSHQFHNPLEDLNIFAQTEPTNNNYNGYRLDQNIPVGNLIEDYELIDHPSSSREGTLIDLGPPIRPPRTKNRNRGEVVVALLTRRIHGLQFDRRNGEYANPRVVEMNPGMLVRGMAEDDWKMPALKDWHYENQNRREGLQTPMEDLSCTPTICAMVTSSDVMKISQEQALHLLSVNPHERIDLHKDIERLEFILGLRLGDRVTVDVDETMRRAPAKVSWIGERAEAPGIWYNVDFDVNTSQWPHSQSAHDHSLNRHFETWNFDMSGSSSVAASNPRLFYSPNQMHMPLKGGGVTQLYDNRRPVAFNHQPHHHDDDYRTVPKPAPRERVIPVTRQLPETERTSRRMPEPDYHAYSSHNPVPPPPASTSSTLSSSQSQPSRSKSAHSMPGTLIRSRAADQNEPLPGEHHGFRLDDPCVWSNNGVEERGIIRFIGYLKGHKTIYAGVEFNNKIGAGTGVFNKEQLFISRDGHAGFVELSSLDPPPSAQHHHRRRLSSSRSQHMPAASGTSISVPVNRHKQASIESLSDPPPPPYTPPSPPRASSAAAAHQQPPPLPPKPIAHVEDYLIDSFMEGNHVVVAHLGAQKHGIVRYLGNEMDEQGDRIVRSAIVELDGEVPTAWRRANEATNYGGRPVMNGVLVPVQALRHNRSNGSTAPTAYPISQPTTTKRTEEFGTMDSGVEKQKCGPAKDSLQLVGRQKGIQGYCNSCYLDATLYAMFVQTNVFDFLLEKSMKTSEKAALFQKILAHEIVFPLRKFHYVRADHVMKLRRLLGDLMPHMTGLTNEEKDPEEILAFIFAEIFNVDPFIKLMGPNQSKDSQFLVPIVVDDWQGGAATSQHLLERHMRSAQVKFAKPPPVLIMQLPRYGQQKVFDKILPLETIDITPFVNGAVAPCSRCGACSELFCPTCFLTRRVFYTEIVFCRNCFKHAHCLPENQDHEARLLSPPGKPVKKPHSHKMSLSAVLCIETSHYVAYVRTASNQWVFFDSMADREGLSDGFNVPVVRECGNMSDWLSLQGWNRLKDADETGQIKAMFGKAVLDPLVGRLLSDSYICFYEDASPAASSSSSSTLVSAFKNMMN